MAAALLAGSPDTAEAMGFGSFGTVPTVQPPALDANPAAAGATATITCTASSATQVTGMSVRVSGGTLPGATVVSGSTDLIAPIAITPGASVTGSIVWSTPAAPGAYTVTCEAAGTPSPFGGSAPVAVASVQVQVAVLAPPPVVDTFVVPSAPVLPGATVAVSATAHDPSGGAVAYAWTATGGSFGGSGAAVTWIAPAAPGSYTVQLTVTGAGGTTATASQSIPVVVATYAGDLAAQLRAPTRVAAGADGSLYVVDARDGRLLVFTPRAELKLVAPVREPLADVAAAPLSIYAATRSGQILELDPVGGFVRRALPVRVEGVTGMAWEPVLGLLWVAQKHADRVVLLRPDGTVAGAVSAAGAQPLSGPVGVAVDPKGGVVWVAQESNENGNLVHAFQPDGTYLRSIVPFGGAAGSVTRAGGLAVDAGGQVYVADLFQGVVQVVSATGASVGTVGAFGAGPGQLKNPASVAIMANGDVVVASTDTARLERFGRGQPLPVCAGDADCDGLPDWWELAHGLNPNWAGDAALDYDHDGLSNAAEYALGTDPRKWDTDGDGFSDGAEVLAGMNPLDPHDHEPIVVAATAAQTGPGLAQVSVSVTSRSGGPCTTAWTQVGGPAVKLRDAASTSPTFVARKAARYQLQAVVTCNGQRAAPVVAEAVVLEAAPRAEPGKIRVVRQGEWFALDGGASWDPNGELLGLAWDQSLGAPIAAPVSGSLLTARARGRGLDAFTLSVTKAGGLSATAEVPVLVTDGRQPSPTALPSSPVLAQVGGGVKLDASSSLWPDPLVSPDFTWTQLEGPAAVALDTTTPGFAAFVAPQAGRYAFEVSLSAGDLRSPPARVEVFVAEQGGALPTAVATAPASAAVYEPIQLDASGSAAAAGAPLTYSWRQVSGPAAGLTGADSVTATIVPFEQGWYEVELTVASGGARSLPVRVAFLADVAGRDRVTAKASGPGAVAAGLRVQLAGEAVGLPAPAVRRGVAVTALPARFHWTQVAGPWIALDSDDTPVPSFRPAVPGIYAFDLVVESGGVRSAPARVSVLVTPRN